MEFDFNINQLFPDVITLVGQNINSHKQNLQRAQLHKNLQIVIDALGRKSAKAQQLSGSITNLDKSLFHGHHIYVLKDAHSNNGNGCVIGFIKVGKKRLFLLDHYGNHNEMHPLCILDFYVHESQQRRGCGLRLFKHMLTQEGIKACHLAIDRPSLKFTSFLKKHFNLWVTIPQVNNFVIFDGFFKGRSDTIRSSTCNNKYSSNSQLRPLSRAVSDDVIRRNRPTQSAAVSFKEIRPVSGYETELNQGHDLYSNRNNRRRRWNPDGTWQSLNNHSAPLHANLYSRFSHENHKATGLPPLHPSRRHFTHATAVANHEVGDEANRQDRPNEDRNDRIPITEAVSDGDKAQTKQSSPILVKSSEDASEDAKCNGSYIVENQSDSSKTIQENKYIPKYSKPSDMIAELKAKDSQQKSAVTADLHQEPFSRFRRRHQKSSWNVFGVPSLQYWSLK